MNTDGTQRVFPLGPSTMKIGLEGSHAVYPRASNVVRMPPEGKLDASGSLWMSWAPLKRSMGRPSSSKVRKASCFSAVRPVWGWNQWQKCVAPLPMAHSFTAWATSLAMAGSSRLPRRTVSCSELKIGLGSFFFIAAASNVLQPNRSSTLMPDAISGSDRMLREATSPMAHMRPESSDIVNSLQMDAGNYRRGAGWTARMMRKARKTFGHAIDRRPAPGARPRHTPRRLPDDVPVAAHRRQGNPAQAAEQDLLPDQRRRARGDPRRRRYGAAAGPR